MPGYISEASRYFRVAKSSLSLIENDSQYAFVVIVFSAMYMEALVNEVIYVNKLYEQAVCEATGREVDSIDIDIYNETESFMKKVKLILGHYGIESFEHDVEYIELKHLFSIRGQLVHLKPAGQLPSGEPEKALCKSALNYLFKNKKIIQDPNGRGVYWNDVLMTREVAEWLLSVAVQSVDYLYKKSVTWRPPYGETVLFHNKGITGTR